MIAYKPFGTALQRYATIASANSGDQIDRKHERAVAKSELRPHPEEVTAVSSVHQIFEEKGVDEEEKDEDMLAGMWQDVV